MILSRDPSAKSFPLGENRTTWIGSVPSWCSPYTSRVLASNTIHLPLVIPTTITSPSDEKQADWAWSCKDWYFVLIRNDMYLIEKWCIYSHLISCKLTPIWLLQTARCVRVSQRWMCWSYPADKNWFCWGCVASAHTSSTWPVTISWKFSSKVPWRTEFFVEPKTSWLPFPWDIVRTDPKCSGSWK